MFSAEDVVDAFRQELPGVPWPQRARRIRGLDVPTREHPMDPRLVGAEHTDIDVVVSARDGTKEEIDGPTSSDPLGRRDPGEQVGNLFDRERLPSAEAIVSQESPVRRCGDAALPLS